MSDECIFSTWVPNYNRNPHALEPAIPVLLLCVKITPITISLARTVWQREIINDSYPELQIAAICIWKPRQSSGTDILCMVLPAEPNCRHNLPPAKMVWKSEPLLFSAVRCSCNEHTMLVWEVSPKCWGLRKRGTWFILFVRQAFIRGKERRRPWL